MLPTSQLRHLIRQSDMDGLEEAILDGHGYRLIGEAASDSKVRALIRAVPQYLVSSMRLGRLEINALLP